MSQHPSPLSPIGLFDSGVGGLTIMKQLMRQLPNEQIVYFGDTARLPYGEKTPETIIRYAIENTVFLMDKKVKLLVVACNTASAHAMGKLRQLFNIPIVDIIEAAVNEAVSTTRNQHIAVLGTRGTIQSAVYENEIRKRLPEANVIPIACPLFTILVEENFASHPAAKLIVKEYLEPLKRTQIDTLILGCTHFPLLASFIQEELPNVTLIDPAISCATRVAFLLSASRLEAHTFLEPRSHCFYVSDDPLKFSCQVSRFLSGKLPEVEKVSSWFH
jgi:glutamate racemase